jgi:hypothetical protein
MNTSPRSDDVAALAAAYRAAVFSKSTGSATDAEVTAAREALAAAERRAQEAAIAEAERQRVAAAQAAAAKAAESRRLHQKARDHAVETMAAAWRLDAALQAAGKAAAEVMQAWQATIAAHSQARDYEGGHYSGNWNMGLQIDRHGDALGTINRMLRLQELGGPDANRVLTQAGRPYLGDDFFAARYLSWATATFGNTDFLNEAKDE